MASKQVALEVTVFLDSREARALTAVRTADLRRVTEAFVELSYEQVGKAPRFLDAEDMHVLLTRLLPARLARKDPAAPHVPAVLGQYLDHLMATQVVTQIFELRRALDASMPEFLEAVESGRFANQLAEPKPAPFAHGAAKLGRNEPCSCGSGKKFKQCHGKSA